MMASNMSQAGQVWGHHQPGLVSLNVGGGTLVICEILRRFKPPVLCLQEVNISTKELNSIVKRLNYQGESNIDPEFPTKQGTAIIWRNDQPAAPGVIVPRCVQSLRLGAAGTPREEQLTVINIYAPTGSAGKVEREEIIAGPLSRALGGLGSKYIVVGDWNSVISVNDVETNYPAKKSPATERLVAQLGLTDAFRCKHPVARSYTFYRASVTRSRLDQGYLSPALVASLLHVSHEPSLGDHAALVLGLHPSVLPVVPGAAAPMHSRHALRLVKATPVSGVPAVPDNSVLTNPLLPARHERIWILNTSILNEPEFQGIAAELWQCLSKETRTWWTGGSTGPGLP